MTKSNVLRIMKRNRGIILESETRGKSDILEKANWNLKGRNDGQRQQNINRKRIET